MKKRLAVEGQVNVGGRLLKVVLNEDEEPSYKDYKDYRSYAAASKEYRQNKKCRAYISDSAYADKVTVPHPKVEDFPGLEEQQYAAYTKAAEEAISKGFQAWPWNGPTVYTQRGAYPEVDKAWDAHNRAIVKAQKEVIDAIREQLLSDTMGKATFSRKVGCSCGCSPGWIVDGDSLRRCTISVLIPKPETKVGTCPKCSRLFQNLTKTWPSDDWACDNCRS